MLHCVLIFLDGLQMGEAVPPQPPRCLVLQARCKSNLSTIARRQCLLILIPVLQMELSVYWPPASPLVFRNASVMQNTTYEKVPEATCSDVLQKGAVPSPQAPRYFVMQARCKKTTCQRLQESIFFVLMFVNGLQMGFRVYRPPKPSPIS